MYRVILHVFGLCTKGIILYVFSATFPFSLKCLIARSIDVVSVAVMGSFPPLGGIKHTRMHLFVLMCMNVWTVLTALVVPCGCLVQRDRRTRALP